MKLASILLNPESPLADPESEPLIFIEAMRPLLDFDSGFFAMLREAIQLGQRVPLASNSVREAWKKVCSKAARVQTVINGLSESERKGTEDFEFLWSRLLLAWDSISPAFLLLLDKRAAPNGRDATPSLSDLAQAMIGAFKDEPGSVATSALLAMTGKKGSFPTACAYKDGRQGEIVWVEVECFTSGAFQCQHHPADLTKAETCFITALGNAWDAVRPSSSTDATQTASVVWRFINAPNSKGAIKGGSASAAFCKAFGHLLADQKVDPRVLVIAEVASSDPSVPLQPVEGITAKVAAAVENNRLYRVQENGGKQVSAGGSVAHPYIPSCIDRIALLPQALGIGKTNLAEARKTLLDLRNSKDSATSKAAHMIDLYDLEAEGPVDL